MANEYQRNRLIVLDRDNWSCSYCGVALIESKVANNAATVDHLVPRSAGGTDDVYNLVACCRVCNAKKGVKQVIRPLWLHRDVFKDYR